MDGRGEESLKVDITTSSVFTRVMTRSLTSMHKVFAMVFATGGKHAQQGKGAKGGKDAPSAAPALPKEPDKHSRWKKTVGPLSKSFISSAVHALEQMTDEAMLAFTYRSLARLAPLMRAHERLARKSMTSALACWHHATNCRVLCVPTALPPQQQAAPVLPRSVFRSCRRRLLPFVRRSHISAPSRLNIVTSMRIITSTIRCTSRSTKKCACAHGACPRETRHSRRTVSLLCCKTL